MTLKKCSCGKTVTTKNGLFNGRCYDFHALVFTCPECKSSFYLFLPLKDRQGKPITVCDTCEKEECECHHYDHV